MDFVVDGATRMKQLIEDLLAYSRVGAHTRRSLRRTVRSFYKLHRPASRAHFLAGSRARSNKQARAAEPHELIVECYACDSIYTSPPAAHLCFAVRSSR